MSLTNKIRSWIKGKEGVEIISDGDWDGITASALLSKNLGIRKVFFPHPSTIPKLEMCNKILVELPPTRGYTVTCENILFDHHNLMGVYLITPSKEERLFSPSIEAKSVLELVAQALGIVLEGEWYRLANAVRLIEEGRSKEDPFAWILHRAYLYNVARDWFRQKVFELLISEDFKTLWDLCIAEAEKYEKARKRVDIIVKRVVIIGRIALTWYNLDDEFEATAFREAMFELEKKTNTLVVVAALKNGYVEKLHIGTMNEAYDASLTASKIQATLKEKGYDAVAGGRRQVAGLQIVSPEKPRLDLLQKILSLLAT